MKMTFELISIQGFLLCITYFFAGVIDSICGGGGLITIPVMLMTGVPTHYITGTNQCSACLGTFAATYNYVKSGKIHYRSALFTVPFAMIGAYLGARLNLLVPERYLEIFMTLMIPVIAIFMIANKKTGEQDLIDEFSTSSILIRSAVIGFVVGGYQGFYGPGGGLFFVLAYAIFLKLSLIRATGNMRIVGGIASLTSTFAYAVSGNVLWKLAIAATLFNIVGSYLGASLAIKNGSKLIRPIMLLVVALLFGKLLFSFI